MSLGMILLTILVFAAGTVLIFAGYYLGSGEKLWKRDDEKDRGKRPPRR